MSVSSARRESATGWLFCRSAAIVVVSTLLTVASSAQLLAQEPEEVCDPESAFLSLAPGEVVTEGVLCGTYTGDADDPALIDTTVLPGTSLTNVIIGENAKFPASPPSSYGPSLRNVRFVTNANIPPGISLSGSIAAFDAPGLSRRIDLDDSVLLSPDPLIEQLRRLIPQASGDSALVQNANGNLQLTLGERRFELFPYGVRQYFTGSRSLPSAPGIFVMGQNVSIRFVTDRGRVVDASVVPAGEGELAQMLSPMDLVPSIQTFLAPLVLRDRSRENKYAFYPGLFNVPAEDGRRPGIMAMPHQNYPMYTQFLHVYEDEAGQLRQQVMFPGLYRWMFALKYIYDATGQYVEIHTDGTVSVTLPSGTTVRAMPDYRLGEGTSPDGIRPAGDLNSDGTVDYVLSYENRDRHGWVGTSLEQMLYVLPNDNIEQSER